MNIPVRRSSRAKNMSIVIHSSGRWEVVVPAKRTVSNRTIETFVLKHLDWIKCHTSKRRITKPLTTLTHQGVVRRKIEQQTLRMIEEVIIDFRRHQPFTVDKIRLRNYKAQWGSCSSGFTLGFHYKLSLLPRVLAQYVIAHELCHTLHFNHSKEFWCLVETLCPEAKACRKALREFTL